MPAILGTILNLIWQAAASAAFSFFVTAAQKSGVINKLDAVGIKWAHSASSAALALKASSKPSDFPNSSASSTEKR